MNRKIIQIIKGDVSLYCLTDTGQIFIYNMGTWTEIETKIFSGEDINQ